MDNLVCVLAVMLLASFAFADCDSTGCVAGSSQNIEIALSNVSGLFNSNANCTMRMWDSANVSVLNVGMISQGDGRFYYGWTVPNEPGSYTVLFNCTDSLKANYTNGGSIFVVSRSFEKAVAHGEATYSVRYENPVAAAEQQNHDIIMLVVGVLLGFAVGLVGYSKLGKR
jgi:hypothetical protein